jgi:hypothetical protein
MELTKEQIKFLNFHCTGKWTLNENGEVDVEGSVWIKNTTLTEIPVKFGGVNKYFSCDNNNLTTLKNLPYYVGDWIFFNIQGNNLTEYFKSIKEEDFPHWGKLLWFPVLKEYPFLVNIGKKYIINALKFHLDEIPQTKLYYRD